MFGGLAVPCSAHLPLSGYTRLMLWSSSQQCSLMGFPCMVILDAHPSIAKASYHQLQAHIPSLEMPPTQPLKWMTGLRAVVVVSGGRWRTVGAVRSAVHGVGGREGGVPQHAA